jgi:hypothetical protein
MAAKQRFCCTTHRVYASREGLYADTASRKPGGGDDGDTSVLAALHAAQSYTPVPIPDHKTVAGIKVIRHRADPNSWEVRAPSSSALAAGKIHAALSSHVGDLLTLANKLGAVNDEPLLSLRTHSRRGKR